LKFKIDQKYLASLLEANQNLLIKSIKTKGSYHSNNVNKVMYILHLFNKLQLDMDVMDPVLSSKRDYLGLKRIVLIEEGLPLVEGKNLSLLIRLVTRTGKPKKILLIY